MDTSILFWLIVDKGEGLLWVVWLSIVIPSGSGVCRSPPPTTPFSVSPLEKTDAQILLARVGFAPTTDPRSIKVGVNNRRGTDTGPTIDGRKNPTEVGF